MRIKKGFTLAEILIVLMVIGVIATMTIPSLMKGVTEAQFKAAYKKAYNTIVNLSAMEKIAGQLPSRGTDAHVINFYNSMVSGLSVKEFYDGVTATCSTLDNGVLYNPQVNPHCVSAKAKVSTSNNTTVFKVADSGSELPEAKLGASAVVHWILTEDGIAYNILVGGAGDADCGTKADINAADTPADAITKSCAIIVVDVNGIAKGPNKLEVQNTSTGGASADANSVASDSKMVTLTRDRYYIYLGADGATAGPTKTTLSGRIIADLK